MFPILEIKSRTGEEWNDKNTHRIIIVGANGVGKTSLVTLLTFELKVIILVPKNSTVLNTQKFAESFLLPAICAPKKFAFPKVFVTQDIGNWHLFDSFF